MGEKMLKNRVRYSAFSLRPSVSFCSASAKNFHFGASLVEITLQVKNYKLDSQWVNLWSNWSTTMISVWQGHVWEAMPPKKKKKKQLEWETIVNKLYQISSFKFYLSHTRLYRDCITSSEMRVGSAPWTVQILKKQHKGSKHKIRWMKNKI